MLLHLIKSKGVEKVTYDAVYQPTFDPSHTFVKIVTPCPWDEGTQQLLKTIHVEKGAKEQKRDVF